MSRDQDGQQRLWLSLGFGGKTAPSSTWRYWRKRGEARVWVVAAPNGLAEFEQRDKSVYFKGQHILTARTQWQATWNTLAYFYAEVIHTVPVPAMR